MDTFLWLLKLSSILFFFAPAAELGVIFALTYALDRFRVQVADDEVALVGPDAWTMMGFFFAGGVTSAALTLAYGAALGALAGAVSLLLMFGCRLELVAAVEGSVLRRKVLGVVPWSVWHSTAPSELFVDGWGDMMDPEALHIDFGSVRSLEIAWGSANSGERADELASEFNDAVRRLNREALRRVVGGALYRASHES